jgi:two-component system, sensor histidine kinase
VWDTGPGIAAGHQERIFQEFVQLDHPAQDGERGLGLGLAIVQRISNLLQHPIRLQSIPGRGSMFAVHLPYGAADAVQIPAGPAAHQLLRSFTGLRVAVLDNDARILDAMCELLERWGCLVECAQTPQELVRKLEDSAHIVDVLICDYRLDDGPTGLDVIEDMRRLAGRPLRAIVITGDTAAELLQDVHAGGYVLLHKPVAPARLRLAVQSVLSARARH